MRFHLRQYHLLSALFMALLLSYLTPYPIPLLISPIKPPPSAPAIPKRHLPLALVLAGTALHSLPSSPSDYFLEHGDRFYVYAHLPSTPAADGRSNILPLPANRGNEALAYLTFIIDHYNDDDLQPVVVFAHAHRSAWHNPILLWHDAKAAMQRLNRAAVVDMGWVGFGCDEFLRRKEPEKGSAVLLSSLLRSARPPAFASDPTLDQKKFAELFSKLFPHRSLSVPEVLAWESGGQFAVSHEAIKSVPLPTWKAWRDWILADDIDGYDGRARGSLIETLWKEAFSNATTAKPGEWEYTLRGCYCSLYGICFPSHHQLKRTSDLATNTMDRASILSRWRGLAGLEDGALGSDDEPLGDDAKRQKLEVISEGKIKVAMSAEEALAVVDEEEQKNREARAKVNEMLRRVDAYADNAG